MVRLVRKVRLDRKGQKATKEIQVRRAYRDPQDWTVPMVLLVRKVKLDPKAQKATREIPGHKVPQDWMVPMAQWVRRDRKEIQGILAHKDPQA